MSCRRTECWTAVTLNLQASFTMYLKGTSPSRAVLGRIYIHQQGNGILKDTDDFLFIKCPHLERQSMKQKCDDWHATKDSRARCTRKACSKPSNTALSSQRLAKGSYRYSQTGTTRYYLCVVGVFGSLKVDVIMRKTWAHMQNQKCIR